MTKSQNAKNEQQKDLCITSISVDMSTEEAPYNRLYARPIEKQGDVLLCEFESANYDIEQKELRKENAQLKEYERIVTSYNMKPIDYDIACETVNKLLDKIERLEKQLRIALAAFRMIRYSHNTIKDRKTGEVYYTWHYAEMKIKELEK